jgi:hypothetical protein
MDLQLLTTMATHPVVGERSSRTRFRSDNCWSQLARLFLTMRNENPPHVGSPAACQGRNLALPALPMIMTNQTIAFICSSIEYSHPTGFAELVPSSSTVVEPKLIGESVVLRFFE